MQIKMHAWLAELIPALAAGAIRPGFTPHSLRDPGLLRNPRFALRPRCGGLASRLTLLGKRSRLDTLASLQGAFFLTL